MGTSSCRVYHQSIIAWFLTCLSKEKAGRSALFPYSDAARRVADLIRTKAHGGKAHVVGLSLGAQTLVELLSRNPELVDHAIVNSASLRSIPGIGMTNMLVKMYSPFKNTEFLIRANMKSLGVPEQYFPQFREDTRQITTTALNHVLTANANYRLPSNLDKATSPVLVVIGQKEYKVMYESARDLVQALPNAKGYIAQGRSHNWSLESPELYAQMISSLAHRPTIASRITSPDVSRHSVSY